MSCDSKCIHCKYFILKLMLNGYDGICDHSDHEGFTHFKDNCDDFYPGKHPIYFKGKEEEGHGN